MSKTNSSTDASCRGGEGGFWEPGSGGVGFWEELWWLGSDEEGLEKEMDGG